MDKDPGVIRAEIEETRERVGDEVDAISYKTDVGARASDYVDDKKEAVKSKITGAKDTVTGAVPDRRRLKRGATHMRDTAASNPLGLAVGGLAVGFLVGTLLPQTHVENEQMGQDVRPADRRRQGQRQRGCRPRQAGCPGDRGRSRRHGERVRP